MKLKDIKVGETYNVRVTVKYIDGYDVVAATIRQDEKEGYRTRFHFEDIPAFSPISPETAPKYNPCRMFRKGDIVRLREYNGRKPYDYWHKQTIKHFGAKLDTVLEDELDSGNVDIFQDAPIDELTVRVNSCHLELVTPVEELEPYNVHETEYLFRVMQVVEGGEQIVCEYRKSSHPNPKAAAEAERDRLNTEHRKGQK
jgi:hypothetical protein